MEPLDIKISVSPKEFSKDYLKLFAGVFDLTKAEQELLAAMLTVHLVRKSRGEDDNPFSPENKDTVMEMTGLSANTLAKYLSGLRKPRKGCPWVIRGKGKDTELNPFLFPRYEVKIKFDIKWK